MYVCVLNPILSIIEKTDDGLAKITLSSNADLPERGRARLLGYETCLLQFVTRVLQLDYCMGLQGKR